MPPRTGRLVAFLGSIVPVDALDLRSHQRDQAVLQLPAAVTLVENEDVTALFVEAVGLGDIVRGGRVPPRPGKAVGGVSQYVQSLPKARGNELGGDVGLGGLVINKVDEGVSNVVLVVSITKDLAYGVSELLEAHREATVGAQGSAVVDDVVRQGFMQTVVLLGVEEIGQQKLGLVNRLVRVRLGAQCGSERGRDKEQSSGSGALVVDLRNG